MRIDADGNVENPYAQLGEWVDERLRGATPHAHDGRKHSVEVLAWARLIDAVLAQISGGLHTGSQFYVEDDSVNFVLNGMEMSDMKAVSAKVRSLPAGCDLRMGDARENTARAGGVARRPHDREYFINVTERAQANLENRRRMRKRVRAYDMIVLVISLIGIIFCGIMLYKHGEGYRDPWGTLSHMAGEALSTD